MLFINFTKFQINWVCQMFQKFSPFLRFFVEDDRTAHREPESILQKQKNDRIEIEDFYTAVSWHLDAVTFVLTTFVMRNVMQLKGKLTYNYC
jgi:hypothetical protein